MIEKGKGIIAIIPARGGSKGVPYKNIRILAKHPLIHYSISAALHSAFINRVIVSTDDEKISEVALREGAEVIRRPPEISGDEAPTIDTILHVIDQIKSDTPPEIVVLLQPTSPLRIASDIDAALEIFLRDGTDSVVGVVEQSHPPHWSMIINGSFLEPLFNQEAFTTRRQDLPRTFLPNGAIFISRVNTLLQSRTFYAERVKPYIMPAERSVDIDTEFDFILAENLLKQGFRN